MLALAVTAAATLGCHRSDPRPSVLLIVVDTLRADRVGALATGHATGGRHGALDRLPGATPVLDGWAAQAARFRHAVSPAPFTMPAVASLFSGKYPDRCGVVAHEPGTSLGPWHGTTLAEAARKAGLATAAVIANPWLVRAGTGFDRGFAQFSRVYHPGQAMGASSAAAVTDDAIAVLDGVADKRFFLWVHYFDPHMPYEPPPAFAQAAGASPAAGRVMSDFSAPDRDLRRLYRGEGYTAGEIDQARRLYDGEIRYTDHEIGRLLDRLDSLGLAAGTLVIVASDHGESLGEHGLYFAHDFTVYEELTRVALLMRGPGIAPGTHDQEVSLIDVAPTVCRLAGLDCSGDFDGRDLFEPSQPERTLFAAGTPSRAKGTPFDRLEVAGLAGRWTMALRNGSKLVRIPTASGPALELYDLAADPGERSNVAMLASDTRRGLESELESWSRAMDAARPAPTSHPHRHKRRRDTDTLRSLGYLQ